jgi:tetratricopeptide (TPR) repeat protein
MGAVLGLLAQPARGESPQRVLVVPFENTNHSAPASWLGEGAAVLLADDLSALGAAALTREERRTAFERLQVPPAASLTDATMIKIGQLVGASQVVIGSFQVENDQLTVRARAVALEPGRIVRDVSEHGPSSDLFATFDRLARALLGRANTVAGSTATHPPVAVFENYVKGLLAGTPDMAIAYLNLALKADPTFDRARIALWDVYHDQGDYARALAAVNGVGKGSTLERRARFLAGLSQIDLKRYDDAFASFKALADAAPAANLFNNMGIVELRRGGAPAVQAPYYFTKAKDLDPDSDYFFNLGYADWTVRDLQASIYWLREAVRRSPADGEAHFVLGVALATAGQPTEAAREKELARRLSSTFQEWEKRPGGEQVPRGLERVRGDVELPHVRALEETLAQSEQRDQKAVTRFYVERAGRLFAGEHDREALQELNRALFLAPYDAEAHLLAGRIHLRAGEVKEAIDALKISLWSNETAEAHAVLGDAYLEAKDTDAAQGEARRALALDPSSTLAKQVLDKANRRRE